MLKLKRWQREAYIKWKQNGYRGTIKGSTGSGKTILGLKAIKQHPNESVLIVVPTLVLQEQWKNEISDKVSSKRKVGLVGGGINEYRQVTIAVVNSIRNVEGMKHDILIMDEIHRFGSMENQKFLTRGYFPYILGLSATPERTDSMVLDIYAPIIYEYTRAEGIQDGMLSPFSVVFKGIELNPEESKQYNKLQAHINRVRPVGYLGSFAQLPYQLRNSYMKRRKILNESEHKLTETVHLVDKHKDEKIIIFTETKKMANGLGIMLEDAEVYHSGIQSEVRKAVIERFESGITKVIVTVKALDEGLNVKNCNIGIVVAGNKMERQTVQRIGRILRNVKDKHAILYFLYGENTVDVQAMKSKALWFKKDAASVKWE